MNEEVRTREPHRLVHAQAAPRRVDAPALTDGIGRPGERDIARLGRRRQKRSVGGAAEAASVGEIFELHTIEDPLIRRKTRE